MVVKSSLGRLSEKYVNCKAQIFMINVFETAYSQYADKPILQRSLNTILSYIFIYTILFYMPTSRQKKFDDGSSHNCCNIMILL